MALDNFAAELLGLLPRLGAPRDSLLMLGRQHLTVTGRGLRADPATAALAAELERLRAAGEGFAEPFLQRMGFGAVDSLDCSDYEGCTLVHDLNRPIPREWHRRYDVVFDGGTLEHVFHFPNAVANAAGLVREGGCLVTVTTSNNYNGHGFYQFSPELFYRLFDLERGFRVELMALAQAIGRPRRYRVEDPQRIGCRVTFGGCGPLLLLMIARRVRAVPHDAPVPFQSDYQKTWRDASAGQADMAGQSSAGAHRPALKRRLRALVPAGLLERYDDARRMQARRRDAWRGVTPVRSLAECLTTDAPPC